MITNVLHVKKVLTIDLFIFHGGGGREGREGGALNTSLIVD